MATKTKKPAPKRRLQQPYPDRWAAMSAETKERLVGDRVGDFDRLAALSEEERAELLEAAQARQGVVVARLALTQEHLDSLREERNVLMIQEALLGARQTDIAEEAGVTSMVVSNALGIVEWRSRAKT